ncbi:aldose 1-epimerase family protein [Glaciibacter superstes]|uniref:aldose 1-epimerase family protein n=1 Tax=Glaciibacter superstes TaxID=501023 RepID=UPI0003B3E05A|nr:aldose 1-epimerase family protein [Glaciibacter superstes]
MTTPLSGTQFELAFGDYTATIASVGATLRRLQHRGRDLVVPFEADEVRPAYRGATLAPWPNRVVDGRYSFGSTAAGSTEAGSTEHQLALTEPARGHALHGLVGWLDFIAIGESPERVLLATTVEAQAGYPFRLQVRVEFALGADGLRTTITTRNTGTDAAPYGTGPHPYLVAGEGRVDDWTLTLPAAQVLTVTADRLIPVELTDVAGSAFDFGAPRVIGDTFIDHAFTELERDAGGAAEVRLTAASGTGVVMRWDTACPWVQVHTADQPDAAQSRIGLAVEPMTCPPDAFNSGTDLIVLEPGELATARWTIAAL